MEPSLREMLSKAGITQKKIAEKARVSLAAVSLMEPNVYCLGSS